MPYPSYISRLFPVSPHDASQTRSRIFPMAFRQCRLIQITHAIFLYLADLFLIRTPTGSFHSVITDKIYLL